MIVCFETMVKITQEVVDEEGKAFNDDDVDLLILPINDLIELSKD